MNKAQWIDGFLLGDGTLALGKTGKTARAQIHVKHTEFAEYMMKGFARYSPCKPKTYNGGISWMAYTHQSGELVNEFHRWYPGGKKTLPSDLRLGPTSLLLWYLGDGMLSCRSNKNSIEIRFATQSFTESDLEHVLRPKLRNIGLDCQIIQENNIRIPLNYLRRFFKLIGRKSPVSCYKKKFAVPHWRFATYSFTEAATILGVHWRLVNQYVFKGNVSTFSRPGVGRRRVTREGIRDLRRLLKKRVPKDEMYGERHHRARITSDQVEKIIEMRAKGIWAKDIIRSLMLDVSTTQIYKIGKREQRQQG